MPSNTAWPIRDDWEALGGLPFQQILHSTVLSISLLAKKFDPKNYFQALLKTAIIKTI